MKRINKLLNEVKKLNIDAILVLNKSNIFYLTGFKSIEGTLLYVTINGDVKLYVPPLEYERALEETAGNVDVVPYSKVRVSWSIPRSIIVKPVEDVVVDNIKSIGGEVNVGIEYSIIPYVLAEKLKSKIENLKVHDISKILYKLRSIKDSEELKLIKKAARIAEEALDKCIESVREGVSEREIAAKIEYLMKVLGAEEPAFSTIVASGKNSSLPHARISSRKLRKRDIVVIDLGAKYEGYCSDMTRTISLGGLKGLEKEVYNVVFEAQREAIKHVKPGIKAETIDSIARNVMKEYGYDKYYIHSTGHGVGIDVHEPPRIGQGSDEILKPNMVFTIEPGIYIKGSIGVRIEDLIVVTETGAKSITRFRKRLIV